MQYTRKKLSAKRFHHVERTVEVIEDIAFHNQLPVVEARTAGWLHDCAKEEPKQVFLDLLRRGRLTVDHETMKYASLWHGFHAAYIGRMAFGIEDSELLDAVRYHPTGSPDLAPIGLALFVADYSEPGRPMSWTREIRDQARTDLVVAALRVSCEKIRYIQSKGKEPHPRSMAFRDKLMSLVSAQDAIQ